MGIDGGIQMQRREFILALGGAMLSAPLAARAQKTKPVIAILGSGAADAGSSKQLMSMLDASMRELGLSRPGLRVRDPLGGQRRQPFFSPRG